MKLQPISQDDENFLEVATDMAHEIVGRYLPDHGGQALTPDVLEQAFGAWLDDPGDYDGATVSNSLGAAFGNFMNRDLGTRWVRVQDQYGEALAVHRDRPDWTTFPIDAVEKRVKSRERSFFVAIHAMAKPKLAGE
jgi:Domain of unknown function (DUF3806)